MPDVPESRPDKTPGEIWSPGIPGGKRRAPGLSLKPLLLSVLLLLGSQTLVHPAQAQEEPELSRQWVEIIVFASAREGEGLEEDWSEPHCPPAQPSGPATGVCHAAPGAGPAPGRPGL